MATGLLSGLWVVRAPKGRDAQSESAHLSHRCVASPASIWHKTMLNKLYWISQFVEQCSNLVYVAMLEHYHQQRLKEEEAYLAYVSMNEGCQGRNFNRNLKPTAGKLLLPGSLTDPSKQIFIYSPELPAQWMVTPTGGWVFYINEQSRNPTQTYPETDLIWYLNYDSFFRWWTASCAKLMAEDKHGKREWGYTDLNFFFRKKRFVYASHRPEKHPSFLLEHLSRNSGRSS